MLLRCNLKISLVIKCFGYAPRFFTLAQGNESLQRSPHFPAHDSDDAGQIAPFLQAEPRDQIGI